MVLRKMQSYEPNMNLEDVQTFQRVVDLGSLSAAARERDVPVSHISRAITRLESLHKVRLLHRSTHALSLTEAGQALLEHGKRMLLNLADLQADFAANQAHISGTVHIGISPAMAQYVIVRSLPALAQRHPQLSVELHADDRSVDIVRQGLDLAIRTGPLGSDNLVARPIGEHGRRLYAAPSYAKQYGLPKTADDLQHHKTVTNSILPAYNRWPFIVGGKPLVITPRGFYRANSTGVIMTMALQGLGIVRGNTAICEPLVARGELVRVLDNVVQYEAVQINAVMLQERHRAPKVRACIEFFAQWLSGEK